MKKIILLLLCLTIKLFSLEYGLDFKVNQGTPITKFVVFGERNSGTNYLKYLVEQNLALIRAKPSPYGHKHFPCWFELPLEFYHGPETKYTFKGSENYLIIVVFRNAYDWLRSMHKKPFYVSKELRNTDFSTFIRTKWSVDPNRVVGFLKENPWLDRNPVDGSPFDNIMKLRTAKIRTMLEIKNRVLNIYYINYETLRDHPEEVLTEIAHLFAIQKEDNFHPVIYYKGEVAKGVYKKTEYNPISKKDLRFINEQLDAEVEKKQAILLSDHPNSFLADITFYSLFRRILNHVPFLVSASTSTFVPAGIGLSVTTDILLPCVEMKSGGFNEKAI